MDSTTGAHRDELKPRYDLIPSIFLLRLAQRYSLGASRYGPYNWERGLPLIDTFNHVIAHLERFKSLLIIAETAEQPVVVLDKYTACVEAGVEDDDLAAAAWGIAALIYYTHNGIYSWPASPEPQTTQGGPHHADRDYDTATDRPAPPTPPGDFRQGDPQLLQRPSGTPPAARAGAWPDGSRISLDRRTHNRRHNDPKERS